MEHVDTLFSKSARKQIERNKSGYKPSKIVQKIFSDLFVYGGAIRGLIVPPLKTAHKAPTRSLDCEMGVPGAVLQQVRTQRLIGRNRGISHAPVLALL